ncbi:6021_t:CDS:2 [Funneliformis mosseae]|uniref:6021_t:CDS:1 n=1 Tax=Funneliformis mosseae TaxID=27381 RepID=A0A9N9HNI9_FUNMO|nr:6021_t:CDS:2 [Funneliformis mosseae]
MSLSKATGGLILSLLYTDADLTMIAAINSIWPTIKHHFCLFHFRKNLEKHFLNKYHGEKWNKFFAAFCYTRNNRVESIFEERWAALLQEYPDATSYLQRYLYPYKEAWILYFTHCAFNAEIQKFEHTIERLLAKESKFIKLNETIGKLPVTVKSPRGMFSEDMFDACVIELAQLIIDLDLTRIRELWRISSINKKSKHFIVLYDNAMHLCTCLILINHGLVCRHFFATMLVSSIAKFHIRLLPQHWYTNISVIEADSTLSNVLAISLLSNNGFSIVKHAVELDFSYLESIRRCHVFIKKIYQEMTRKQQ